MVFRFRDNKMAQVMEPSQCSAAPPLCRGLLEMMLRDAAIASGR
jgi:hypothetical protein